MQPLPHWSPEIAREYFLDFISSNNAQYSTGGLKRFVGVVSQHEGVHEPAGTLVKLHQVDLSPEFREGELQREETLVADIFNVLQILEPENPAK